MKNGFTPAKYGERSNGGPGKPIELADAEVLERVDIALARGAVVAGRVVDDYGDPVADATIAALRYKIVSGKRRLLPIGPNARSNDIGQFRLAGLPAGEYILSALYRPSIGGVEPGSPGNSDFALTYFPGSANVAEAIRVSVRTGEELSADVQLVVARGASVSGTVVDSSGMPLGRGQLSMRQAGVPADGTGRVVPIAGDGTFNVQGLPPGTYTIVAMGTRMYDWNLGKSVPLSEQRHEIGQATLTLGGENLSGVQVATSRGGILRGRLLFEGRPPADVAPEVSCFATESDADLNAVQSTSIGAGLTFELRGAYGPCLLAARVSGWFVKTIRINGTDVTDTAIDVPTDRVVDGVDILFTQRAGTLVGDAKRENEKLRDYAVVIFPTDKTRWTVPSRRMRTVVADQTGNFRITGLPVGDYLVAAVEALEDGAEQDFELLERLRPDATEIRVTESATSVSLEAVPAPGQR